MPTEQQKQVAIEATAMLETTARAMLDDIVQRGVLDNYCEYWPLHGNSSWQAQKVTEECMANIRGTWNLPEPTWHALELILAQVVHEAVLARE